MGLFYFALQFFEAITGPADQQGEAREGQPVDQKDVQHAGIDRSAAADDRLRMLSAKEPNGKVNERDAEGSEDRQRGGEDGSFSAGGKAAQDKIADVDQPEDQGGGEAHIPSPPDAPNRARPDRAGD